MALSRRLLLAAAILLGGAYCSALQAAERLSDAAAVRQRLARPVSISWSGNTLREALGNLSQTQGITILLDRRVDPGQEMQLRLANQPLEDALARIAQSRQLGVSRLGPVVYFGPEKSSERLRTVAALRTEEIRRLPTAAQRTFLLPEAMAWDDLAEPRGLLADLAERAGLRIEGTRDVPHDLWAAADLPPLSLVDRLTLLLIQFDLSFEPDAQGKAIRLTPLPDEVTIGRMYPGGPEPESTAARLRRLVPNARVSVVDGQVEVVGLIEDHERLDGSRPSGGRPATHDPGDEPGENLANQRFTLRVEEEPVGGVIRAIAKQMQFELRIDDAALAKAGRSLDAHVSFSVSNATVDELLRAVLEPAGLQHHRRDRTLEIEPIP